MSKGEYTSLPMQSLSVDEKHDPIHGHAGGARVANGVGAGSSPSQGGAGSGSGSANGGSVLPGANMNRKNEKKVHPAVIIVMWILISMSVIIYNAYILKPEKDHGLGFKYPIFLTTFHMAFSTVGTRVLARYTHMLDGLANVEMTNERWLRNILPIGALFSASLALSNYAYLYLSVAYIQMIKAFMPVATLFMSVVFGLRSANSTQLAIISLISFGVALASYGELHFSMIGFIFQATAILFESTRLVMIQVLLQGLKMDPLVSLYYFAPVCAAILAVALPFIEGLQPFFELQRVGVVVLLSNASCAFALNIAAVMLIGAASSLVLTLAGVIKDILLIAGSCVILATQISGLQYIGYSFSLTGLVLYKRYGN